MKKPYPLFLSLGLILLALVACSAQETTFVPVEETSPTALESTATHGSSTFTDRADLGRGTPLARCGCSAVDIHAIL